MLKVSFTSPIWCEFPKIVLKFVPEFVNIIDELQVREEHVDGIVSILFSHLATFSKSSITFNRFNHF